MARKKVGDRAKKSRVEIREGSVKKNTNERPSTPRPKPPRSQVAPRFRTKKGSGSSGEVRVELVPGEVTGKIGLIDVEPIKQAWATDLDEGQLQGYSGLVVYLCFLLGVVVGLGVGWGLFAGS